jgi:uncharacterized LabA/DUF88 family protein
VAFAFSGGRTYRVGIFIDGGYVDKLQKYELGGLQISFEKLAQRITAQVHPQADLFRTYYYNALPYQSNPPTKDEAKRFGAMQNFLDAINRLPRFVVRLGRCARRGPDPEGRYSFEQKMVDVYLSIDLIQLSLKNIITHAAIVAGDSDFVPAIEVARNEGVMVYLFHGQRPHIDLKDNADERFELNQQFVQDILWHG